MKLNSKLIIVTIIIFAIISSLYFIKNNYYKSNIYIALVAPLSGKSSLCGKAYLNGAKMYIDKKNKNGGVNGSKIVLDSYDDQNDKDLARIKALEVVNQKRAVSVIGHHYSSCSIQGGIIYNKHGIPAISPTSSNINVTLNNPWYFRAIFHDNFQARFMANYALIALKQNKAVIISESLDYGMYLAEVFEKRFTKAGSQVTDKYFFDTAGLNLEKQLIDIVDSLKSKYSKIKKEMGLIFLSSHVPEGSKLIKMIREAGINLPIIVPDSFAGNEFLNQLSKFPAKHVNTGLYTNQLHIAFPFIYDIANKNAQQFKQEYIKKYNETPDWRAAFAYDSAKTIVNAIEKTQSTGLKQNIKKEREAIRKYLSQINNVENAVDGLTGLTYFDKNGDTIKPLFIGNIKNKNITSALTQFQEVDISFPKKILEKKIKEKSIVLIEDHYMYKTNVVYTGIKINNIENISFRNYEHTIDFYIWFRFIGDIDPANIVFFNAIEPVKIGKPIQSSFINDEKYLLYQINGKFKTDFSRLSIDLVNHTLGFSFRHKDGNSKDIIYVSDVSGMNTVNIKSQIIELNQSNEMRSYSDWIASNIFFYSDTDYANKLGNPEYITANHSDSIEFSRYNYLIQISKKNYTIRGNVANIYLKAIITILVLIVLLASITFARSSIYHYPRTMWLFQSFLIFLLLIFLESILMSFCSIDINSYYSGNICLMFDILWWIIPTFIINMAIKRFIWLPLEQKSNRKIPKIVTKSIIFFTFLLATFGIIAYVFDQKLTSLLATSGVLAMIIGLAIQVNISNIFSGIVINLEHPFRIGDWIKVDDKFRGKVIDITWRTTRIKTMEDTILSFPNSFVSESPINNYSYPNKKVWIKITIHVNSFYSPDRIKKICMDAMQSIDGLVKEQDPIIRFELTDWSADYTLIFCIDNYEYKFKYKSDVYERVWTHLNRIGIEPAIQRQEIHMFQGRYDRGEIATSPITILQEIDIFQPLADEIKNKLSENMNQKTYIPDDTIISQGEEGDSLFVIVEGSVAVKVSINNKDVEVDRMGAGAYFGEMALLTGEPRTASILAKTHCTLYEITKNDIAPLFEQYPKITEILSQALTKRTINREYKKDKYNASLIDKEELNSKFLSKISKYFKLTKTENIAVEQDSDLDFDSE